MEIALHGISKELGLEDKLKMVKERERSRCFVILRYPCLLILTQFHKNVFQYDALGDAYLLGLPSCKRFFK